MRRTVRDNKRAKQKRPIRSQGSSKSKTALAKKLKTAATKRDSAKAYGKKNRKAKGTLTLELARAVSALNGCW